MLESVHFIEMQNTFTYTQSSSL